MSFGEYWVVLLLIGSILVSTSGFSSGPCNKRTRLQFTALQETPASRRHFVRGLLWGIGAFSASVVRGPAAATEEQYLTAVDIPKDAFDSHKQLYGFVERVIDGDTIRIRHIPEYAPGLSNNLNYTAELVAEKPNGPISNYTIVVRAYGVDSPETAKGKDDVGQPFGEEAKQFTKDLTFHQIVQVRLLKKDKYNRVLGEVETLQAQDLSIELVSRGLATMYIGGGAEYDGKRELLQLTVEEAKRARRGIWSLEGDLTTPAEFKRLKKAVHAVLVP